ncbi:MAG TPA: ABC transporter permease, partial [Lachnospiraceae bacterium]|nr:ABC transporter permease [Lachnospiraceae bacterium]
MQNIVNNKEQLNELPDALPVFCKIINLNGSQESGLEISEELVDQLQTSSQVADLCVTNPLMAGVGEFEEKDWQTKLDIKVTAANTVSAISGLSQDLLTMEDGTTAEFLQTDRYACIVSEDLLKEKNWSVGDVIPLNLYSYVHTNKYQVNFEPLQLTEYEIAGTMDRFVSTSGQSGRTPEIIIPFETVRELYHQKGIAFTADSASFYVADPLDLNEFKEEMQGYGLLSKAPDALYSYQGNTLLVRDSSFISTASKLRQGFDILTGFLPAVVLTVIFIGYIISILLTDSRQTEYALMRIQGMRAGLCFLTFFLEEFLIVLFGCVISGG